MFSKGSGKFCSIYQCNNSAKKRYLWNNSICDDHGILHKDCPCLVPFSLHTFPNDHTLRQQWITSLNRKGFEPGKSAVVCSIHFVDGMPTPTNPTPQLSLGYDKKATIGRAAPKRLQMTSRSLQPRKCRVVEDENPPSLDNSPSASESLLTAEICCNQDGPISVAVQTDTPIYVDKGVQWEDPSKSDHNYCATKRLYTKTTQTDFKTLTYLDLTDKDCQFYTGIFLPVFLNLVSIMSSCVTFSFGLPVGDQLLIVLMRLRLGLIYADLARRFDVSTSLVCKIVTAWLPVLSRELRFLICWLSRETIRSSLPKSFKDNYPKTTCIIDCTEMFINRPTLLSSRALTYSSYKHHNTVKTMVCISPCGYFMFISKSYGGRASDKYIISDSKIMDHLLPGDEIMADRGFTIDLEVASKQVKLNVPAFTKGKIQLSENEVTSTRRIASVRINVERAIGRLKQFRMLKNVLPSKILKKQIDDILIICAALCNLQSPILRK